MMADLDHEQHVTSEYPQRTACAAVRCGITKSVDLLGVSETAGVLVEGDRSELSLLMFLEFVPNLVDVVGRALDNRRRRP